MSVSHWGLGQVALQNGTSDQTRGVREKGKSAVAKVGSEDSELMTFSPQGSGPEGSCLKLKPKSLGRRGHCSWGLKCI